MRRDFLLAPGDAVDHAIPAVGDEHGAVLVQPDDDVHHPASTTPRALRAASEQSLRCKNLGGLPGNPVDDVQIAVVDNVLFVLTISSHMPLWAEPL